MADNNTTYSVTGSDTQIDLGIRGENLANGVLFDVSPWVDSYGEGGGFTLRVTPHGWETFYPVTLTSYSSTDKTVGWDIDSAATAVDGSGELQLVYIINDIIKASRVWRTYVHLSITTSDTAPDPYEDWAASVSEQVSTATQAANDAKAIAVAISAEIGEQVEEYISEHQDEIAEKISATALANKLDKDDADVLAVLAKY